MIRFGDPGKIALLWALVLAFILMFLGERKRRAIMDRFASEKLRSEIMPWSEDLLRKVRSALLLSAVLLIVLAFMRPQLGYAWREVERRGLDIFIALDVSNSMLAEDLKPNRLERAKMGIYDLLNQLYSDRVGLIVFAGEAFVKCPLTLDHGGFLLHLDDADTYSVPVGGTSLAAPIRKAVRSFAEMKAEGADRLLILVTDGEDLSGGVRQAVELARSEGIKIFTVGVGTPEGELIPLPDGGGFMRDERGDIVVTRLDEGSLKELARQTGGVYIHASEDAFGLERLYDDHLSRLKTRELEDRREKVHHEWFQVPLALAFLLLLVEPFVTKRGEESL